MPARPIDERPGDDPGLRTVVAGDEDALAEEAVALLIGLMEAALAARSQARIILAGGATPRATYQLLAERIVERQLAVRHLRWFFGDERWVTRDSPESNEGMARESLLAPIGAPEGTIHSWRAGEGDPVEKARIYDGRLGALPPDVTVLGLGPDGHTASLFPGATAVLPDGRRVPVAPDIPSRTAAVETSGGRGWRLTLCPVYLSTSRSVVFLVAGANKAAALSRARSGDPSTPGAWIRGGATHFIVTREAMGPERPDYGKTGRQA